MPPRLFKAGEPRPENAGRKPGSANKLTMQVRTAIALAAYHLGGWERLVEWVKSDPVNEFAFWTSIWPRLMPVRVEGSGPGGELELNVKLSPEELARKCEERGLPLLVFGIDKPMLDDMQASDTGSNGSDAPMLDAEGVT